MAEAFSLGSERMLWREEELMLQRNTVALRNVKKTREFTFLTPLVNFGTWSVRIFSPSSFTYNFFLKPQTPSFTRVDALSGIPFQTLLFTMFVFFGFFSLLFFPPVFCFLTLPALHQPAKNCLGSERVYLHILFFFPPPFVPDGKCWKSSSIF